VVAALLQFFNATIKQQETKFALKS